MRSPTHCTSCCASVGADAYIGPTVFFPHPRQGTRALPYKVLCYRARAGRVVRPYKSATGGAMWASPPTHSMKLQQDGASRTPPLRNSIIHRCVGATLVVARRTTQKGRTRWSVLFYIIGFQPVSRKCPDWRARQCPSVGRHNGGQESPAPTHHQEPTAPGGQGRPPLQAYS